jgi:predicted RNA-binding protein
MKKQFFFAAILCLSVAVAGAQNKLPTDQDMKKLQEDIRRSRASLDSTMRISDSLIKARMYRADSISMQNNFRALEQMMRERKEKQDREFRVRLIMFGSMLLMVVIALVRRYKKKKNAAPQ